MEDATAAISSTFPEPMSVAGPRRGRRCMISAATWPPALRSSSRNSASDSSALRPREDVPGKPAEMDESPEASGGRVSGAELPGGSTPKRSPGVARPWRRARLVAERGSRSTATRTARSGPLPRRAGTAAEVCERPRTALDLLVPRTNQRRSALTLFSGRLGYGLHGRRNGRRTDAP